MARGNNGYVSNKSLEGIAQCLSCSLLEGDPDSAGFRKRLDSVVSIVYCRALLRIAA